MLTPWGRVRPTTKYQIIEIEKPRQVADLDPESIQAITALAAHPGFVYLVAKLKYQRSLLETKLKNSRHESLRDVEFLQSGIFWSKWLEEQVNQAVFHVNKPAPVEANETEREAFDRALAALEVVGQQV